MSTTYNNPVSSMSYTNRDFSTIFPEMLDLAKQLTSRWDPSVSNESDPGVVLLKLNAILADKLNYNIDKNVLECFPLSVTQRSNARQLYKQLGYTMGYYKSAMTTVAMSWISTDTVKNSDYYATIPPFTMVTDEDNTIVYSLLGPVSSDGTTTISSQRLPLDGSSISWNAIQGIPVKYSINSSEVITSDLLDENNRLYFDVNDIAENGIFITHTNDANDYALWKKVDNLLSVTSGVSEDSTTTAYYYSFGVNANEDVCFIEFSDDAIDVFKNGIEITYIRTLALDGIIPYGFMSKFDTNLSDLDTNYDSLPTLSSSNVKITNLSASTGAADIESLTDAYRNYQKTIGTYNTLVTLRDYLDACITGDYASNGYVCSRNNDIQSSYKIAAISDLSHTIITKVDTVDLTSDSDKLLNAFNLKFYLTGFSDNSINTEDKFNATFKLLDATDIEEVVTYLSDLKSIEHEITDIITPYTNTTAGTFRTNVCLYKAIFPITARITSTRTLATAEKEEVISNIKSELYSAFSAKNIVLGAAPDAADISEVILSSDSRIYSVHSEDITPEIYAIYWNGMTFRSIRLAAPRITNQEFAALKATDPDIAESDYNLEYFVSCSYSALSPVPQYVHGSYTKTFAQQVENTTGWGIYKFLYKGLVDTKTTWVPYKFTGGSSFKWEPLIPDASGAPTTISDVTPYIDFGDSALAPIVGTEIYIEVNPSELIKEEVVCKSILAGTTKYLIKDTEFNYDIDQSVILQEAYKLPASTSKTTVPIIDYVNAIRVEADITLSNTVETQLADNENLQFFSPNLLENSTYNDYVKYEAHIPAHTDISNRITSGASYKLANGEYIIFYWKDTTSDNVYKYHIYGEGNVICPTFDISLPTSSVSSTTSSIFATMLAAGATEYTYRNQALTIAESKVIEALGSSVMLSGSSEITMKKENIVTLDAYSKIYWTLNNKVDGEYVLFEEDGAKTYTLGSGEYFIYANSALSQMQILGAGTKIERPSTDNTRWAVTAIDMSTITSIGTSSLVDLWFVFPDSSVTVKAIEQQFISLGSGVWVKSTKNAYTITSSATALDSDEQVYYSTATTPAEDDWIALPKMLLGSEETWEVRSALSLNVGPSAEQKLAGNHKIIFTQDGHSDTITVYGESKESDKYPSYFMASQNIISTGVSGMQNVYEIDNYGNKVYPSLYVYTKQQSTDNIKYASNGGAALYLPVANTENFIAFKFTMPLNESSSSGMILSLYNPYTSGTFDFLKVYEEKDGVSNTPVHVINGAQTDFSEPGMYLLQLFGTKDTTSQTVNYKLELHYQDIGATSTKVLTLLQAFKYDANSDLPYTYDEIQNLFKIDFDTNNDFDYTYDVPDDNLIEDPLDPLAFLNASHIYNQNTLSQIDTSAITLNIYSGKA